MKNGQRKDVSTNFPLRMPEEVREGVKRRAQKKGVSANEDIVQTIRRSLQRSGDLITG